MSATTLSHEVALRIGLAARILPEMDTSHLFSILNDLVGLPPTEKKLSALKLSDLKSAHDSKLNDINQSLLKTALSLLKGETGITHEPLPEITDYQQDMADSIRVAFASNSGENLDGHFGSCQRFLIYQVAANEYQLIAIRNIDISDAIDDKNAYRASLINDCQLLFVASIGGPAAAKVVRSGIHPIKKPQAGLAKDEILALQPILAGDAPPWLAKVMGHTAEQRIRFNWEADS